MLFSLYFFRHARNTRLRKKIYIEKLKKSVSELSAQRDRVQEEERRRLEKSEKEQKDYFDILQTFFECRTKVEDDLNKWREIITEDFIMILPITPYRSFDPSEVTRDSSEIGNDGTFRVVRGIDGVMADNCSFFVMLQSISRFPNAHGSPLVKALYHRTPEDMIVSDDIVMCRWLLMTENAVACGASSEVNKSMLLPFLYVLHLNNCSSSFCDFTVAV